MWFRINNSKKGHIIQTASSNEAVVEHRGEEVYGSNGLIWNRSVRMGKALKTNCKSNK